ncbi:hypothetical protein [Bdellovibrio bacteriovorus]|uniref:hypothetical protein n=1 Tax=Bdellovibrio bacteriovorus TaxID=959 RepID=UPI0035A9ADA0
MFKMAIGFVLMTSAAHATMPMVDKCTIAANYAAMDFGGIGVDPDGTSITFDSSGATQISRPENIVSRVNKDGVETIIYKTRQIKMDGSWKPGQNYEYETVQRTIVVKRENGKIVSVGKEMDIPAQVKMRKQFEKSGFAGKFPYTKSFETNFSHNGSNCNINQTLTYEMADEKAKVEGKVNYDKEFCDKLAPIVNRMGSQNASQCVGLIGQAQFAFDQRNKELQKEGKSFKTFDYLGKKEKDPYANMNIGMMIQSCAMADFQGGPWGMPGGLMAAGGGMIGGGGMMGMPSGNVIGAPVKAEAAKPAKANTGAR